MREEIVAKDKVSTLDIQYIFGDQTVNFVENAWLGGDV